MEKQIDSTTIYDGAIIKVTKEHVLLQDGNTAVRECVYHKDASYTWLFK